MVKYKHKGKLIVVSNKDYEQILRRFDIDNFELRPRTAINSEYIIYACEVSCPLCDKHADNSTGCIGCTFSKFSKRKPNDGAGCLDVIFDILGPRALVIGSKAVTYDRRQRHVAEGEIK